MSEKKMMLVALVTTAIVLLSSTYLGLSLISKSKATDYESFNKIIFEDKSIDDTIENIDDGSLGEAIIEEDEPEETAPVIIQRITVGSDGTTSSLIINGKEPDEVGTKTSANYYVSNNVMEEPEVVTSSPVETITTPVTPTTTPSKAAPSTSSSSTTKKVVSTMPYYIKVNLSQNVVNIYTKGVDGEYTVPYKAMICSTGTSTPKAGSKYKITSYRRTWNGLKGNVYGQYAVQIVGNILFHSVPYTSKDKSSLEYWEYDKLGTKASLGCIRLTVEDAKWIYDNIGAGTWVEFYDDVNPGPFGKPSAMKISNNELCRNWDPTDYVSENPWLNQSVATVDEPQVIENIETTTQEVVIESGEHKLETISSIITIESPTNELTSGE